MAKYGVKDVSVRFAYACACLKSHSGTQQSACHGQVAVPTEKPRNQKTLLYWKKFFMARNADFDRSVRWQYKTIDCHMCVFCYTDKDS